MVTTEYIETRAKDIIADPILKPLVMMILACSQEDAEFFLIYEREKVENEVIQYLKKDVV